ncbi:MAG: cobalamin biosynthesis protein CbiX [Verrucomicrobia bacterium]|nr:cobalamin biosynthesis protein CbiX [Verrucomicrobiota bacterium]
MLHKPQSALLIIGHGSTVNPDSSAPTFDHAETILRQGVFKEVHCAFWKEEPSFRQVLHMVDSDDVYIVTNFISEGYFTRTVIPRELELEGPITLRKGRTLKYCEPVGNHPRMSELLLKRAAEVAPGVAPADTSLLIVGHGTNLNDNSAFAAKREVDRIRELGIYGEVLNTYMEEAPLVSDWDTCTSYPNVVVVPFFIADGLHSYQDIPVLLGIEQDTGLAASQRDVFRQNPYHLRDKTLYYASAIGTEPLFADLILDQVALFDAQHSSDPVPATQHPSAHSAT